MRVLIIAQYFPPDMGGGATRAYNAAIGLTKAGCDVTVVCAFPHYPTGNTPSSYRWRSLHLENQKGIRVIRTFVPPLSSTGFIRRLILFFTFMFTSLIGLFYVNHVDAVWASNPNVLGVTPGFIFKTMNRCILVQNVDDLWPESLYDLGYKRNSFLGLLGEFLAKISYFLVDAITPISPGYVSVLTKKYNVPQSRIVVVKAGVNLENFNSSYNDDTVKKPFEVLYIGTFSPAYDFKQIFDAASILKDEEIIFTIRGGGELSSTLKKWESESNSGNIQVVDEIVSREDVAKILQSASALILPLGGMESIELGISSKLYEYQAAGKPIICCSRGHPGAYVQESNCGFVVEPKDSAKLAEVILKLKEDSDLARKMGESGRNYVSTFLSIESIGRKLKRVFSTTAKVKH